MRILLIGSGGREHALAWALGARAGNDELFIAPGNAGTAELGQNTALDILDFPAVGRFVSEHRIELLVVGPEQPLVAGIRDYFESVEALSRVPVFGPPAKGALLEGSKSFAKEFMKRHEIPTARYREITAANLEEGFAFMDTLIPPIVIKADGLAAGKGVLIIDDHREAREALKSVLSGRFGTAGKKVVIEEFLPGTEMSVFALCDGKHYVLLPTAKDYKRIGEGDRGPNTGGMGAIAPVPFAGAELMKKIEERIVKPTVKGLVSEGIDYRGVIYFGLMIVKDEPYVIEYNCRFGDPEAEVIIPLIKDELPELLYRTALGRLGQTGPLAFEGAAATVILASGGYPGTYEKGKQIRGLEEVKDSIVFHAGTRRDKNGQLLSNGGRVMAVTSLAPQLSEALKISMKNAAKIEFEGKYFRRDIGQDVVE